MGAIDRNPIWHVIVRSTLVILLASIYVVWQDGAYALAAYAMESPCHITQNQGNLCSDSQQAIVESVGVSNERRADVHSNSGCPMVTGQAVICSVPSLMALAVGEEQSPCPIQIGEGVICTGPDIPDDGDDNGTNDPEMPAGDELLVPIVMPDIHDSPSSSNLPDIGELVAEPESPTQSTMLYLPMVGGNSRQS